MLLKEIVMAFGIISLANSQMTDIKSMYLNFFVHLASVKKSVDNLKLQMEMKNEKPCCTCDKSLHMLDNIIEQEEAKEKARKLIKPIFDIRFDTLPQHCSSDVHSPPPSNCAKATDCTRASGYYNITVSHYSDHSFMVFCDIKFLGGDWLYILRRQDGSEDFDREWVDYVKGFGNVVKEYWIGLENLYALTNFDGPQELCVFIEDWEGETRYAKYNHFVVGSVHEGYKVKSLGSYSGNAGDSLSQTIDASFSTIDSFKGDGEKCDEIVGNGWWNHYCGDSNPTGTYYQSGNISDYLATANDLLSWRSWKVGYSFKTMNFMIRRQTF